MRGVVLSIGDELVLGQTVDTNSAFLSAELVRLGIGTLYHQTVADDRAAIADAIKLACEKSELVIITGGLGPTEDDLTRDALADAMGVELVLHGPSVEVIRKMFANRSREMPERNKVQAMHPVGSEVIPNSCGTAPGIKARLNRATLYVTPGVPSEMLAMWRLSILPEIKQIAGDRGPILTAKINTFGSGESTIAEKLGELMDRKRNPLVGTTVAGGVVSVRVRSEFAKPQAAKSELEDTIRQIESRLGHIVYGRDDPTLAEAVFKLLRGRNQKIATAESCTGGWLGTMITDLPGSSAVYVGGWVTYSNAMKMAQLGVSETLLAEHGAVSRAVASAMARGALERSGADWSLSITGIAGPDGGTPDKPVGTVWIGVAEKGGAVDTFLLGLGGQRDIIRDRSAKAALQLLRFRLLGVPLEEITLGKRINAG